jgi:YidC/Oxa1 family membrane protein insertase
MQDNKNFFLAIALSMAVLVGWNVFFGMPQMEKQRQSQVPASAPTTAPVASTPGSAPVAAPAVDGTAAPAATRDLAIASVPRVVIDSTKVKGSIALRGADIDDIALKDYRETVDPTSPNIVVFSPGNGPDGYFARFGWLPAGGATDVPNAQTLWTADGATLTEKTPVTLTWDNNKGLVFKRKISIDDGYMLTIDDTVEAKSGDASLVPYGLIRRIGTPQTSGYYILHEGLLGVFGDQGLKELTYSALDKEAALSATERGVTLKDSIGGWVGITDKYWASAIVPDQSKPFNATMAVATPTGSTVRTYQTLVTNPAVKVESGQTATNTTRLFVGAKEVSRIDGYERTYGIKLFDRLIDWGWFYWITKPLFILLDAIYRFIGNFGVAILVVTVLVKLVFFPLANKSYSSMAKMKAVQPQMQALREQYPDDKVKQQQELMELYKREKINPLAGCLPVIIQIPVFFALYKVLFVTIEMRHAPFFGWIRDLAAPDPTSIFNLFGLLPFAVPAFLLIGVWPIIMGFTMFVQMKMNPEPQDPIQKTMFTWMPVFFTFLLASFPAGLVIYWSWNNLLSVLQQYMIMKRQGVKVELWDNLRGLLSRKSGTPA